MLTLHKIRLNEQFQTLGVDINMRTDSSALPIKKFPLTSILSHFHKRFLLVQFVYLLQTEPDMERIPEGIEKTTEQRLTPK